MFTDFNIKRFFCSFKVSFLRNIRSQKLYILFDKDCYISCVFTLQNFSKVYYSSVCLIVSEFLCLPHNTKITAQDGYESFSEH